MCLQQTAAAKPKPGEAYQVPPDFDKSVLHISPQDLGSKEAAQAVLPQAFWLRWFHLRQEVCAQHIHRHLLAALYALFPVLFAAVLCVLCVDLEKQLIWKPLMHTADSVVHRVHLHPMSHVQSKMRGYSPLRAPRS